MVGIRFYGRGGQGAVAASKILANAYFKQGLYVQAFPSFGMERKGAAVSAFVRLDNVPIVERGEIKHPSSIIVLDPSLLHKVAIAHTNQYGSEQLLRDEYLAGWDNYVNSTEGGSVLFSVASEWMESNGASCLCHLFYESH